MPELKHHWTNFNPFQAANTTLDWTWLVGENQHYWGYSVRPFQANSDFEILRQFTTSDNNMAVTEHFTVRTASGGLVRFSALVAIGA